MLLAIKLPLEQGNAGGGQFTTQQQQNSSLGLSLSLSFSLSPRREHILSSAREIERARRPLSASVSTRRAGGDVRARGKI
jgi:hypothetical protein